jgi:predicted N-acetyltransferase YhbS
VIEVRAAEAGDEHAVLGLLDASLGWVPDDRHREFFAWKHQQSPFGPSPAWVATEAGRVVGFRTFLRWELVVDGEILRAARAVDTATHPDHQGQGVFSRLTRHGLDALAAEGVAFVFNTPNERSRPGYLKMGWRPVARLPVLARPRSPAALLRLARARTAAGKWSEPCDAGEAAVDALADTAAVAALLAAHPPPDGVTTHRTPAYLAWRYGYAPLGYRVVTGPEGTAGGMVVFRLRRRGASREATVCEELVPGGDARLTSHLLARALRESGADHAVRLAGGGGPRAGYVPVPGQGPTLVWRGVTRPTMPDPDRWRLAMGDVELL